MSFEIAVQTVVYGLLAGSAELNSLVEGIYDEAPEDATFPYVTIGESVHNEGDTVNTLGDDASVTVHCWSRYRGKKEVKEIQGAIYNALHRASATYSGYDIIDIHWDTSQSFTDQDGLTRHGVQSFTIFVDKA